MTSATLAVVSSPAGLPPSGGLTYGHRMKRTRIVLLPMAVVVSAGLLAGCGGGGSTGSTSSSATSADSSSSSSSASSADAEAGGPAAGEKVPGAELATKMLAAMQEAKTMKVTNEGSTGTTTADVVYADGTSSSHATVDMSGSALELIAINNGEEIYVKSPSLGLATWTKVEESSTNPMVQAMASSMASMKPMMDPAAGIKVYEQAGDFTSAGPQTVNGVATTKYTGALPIDAVVAMMGPTGEQVKSQLGTEPIPVEIYLDAQNRPIKLSQSMTVAGQTVASSTTYSDFGADIKVEAPQVGS